MIEVLRPLIRSGLLADATHLSSIDSTNRYAMDLSRDRSIKMPHVVVADQQVSGRGRHGRTWLSDEGTLTFSLIADVDSQWLPIACGVAVAQGIESLTSPISCQIKWPNDVWLNGGKVAGILIERAAKSPATVIGVGINVCSRPDVSGGDARVAAASIDSFVPDVTRSKVLNQVVTSLLDVLSDLPNRRANLVGAFRSRCVLTDSRVRCQVDGRDVEGVCEGIDDDGCLTVATPVGRRTCRAGDVIRVHSG